MSAAGLDRRTMIVAAGAVAAAGSTLFAGGARASKGRIGYLHPNTLQAATYEHMGPMWRKHGFVEGETVLLRSAGGDQARITPLLEELVRSGVDVLIVIGPHAVKGAHQLGSPVPVVAVDLESDPVGEGFARSFARPGGRMTGLFMDIPDLAAKWLQLLTECAPGLERVVIIWDPVTGRSQVSALERAARHFRISVEVIEVNQQSDGAQKIRALRSPTATGVIKLGAPAGAFPDEPLATALRELKLPSMFHLKRYVAAGGLMSYGPRLEVYFPRAVELAVRILGGAKPGELPIEKPDLFDFVVNLGTARVLGLTLPPSILLRADEVIE